MKNISSVEKFGALLKKAREAKELSQRQLSKLSKVSYVQISKYERDKSVPTTRIVQKLVDALEIPADYFFDKKDKATSTSKIDAFSRDYREIAKHKLSDDQLSALHGVIKIILNAINVQKAVHGN